MLYYAETATTVKIEAGTPKETEIAFTDLTPAGSK
jgi:hypothetical protein